MALELKLIQGKQIDVNLTGSFTGSFTGDLTGTASYAISSSNALTASYLEGYISPFPFTGSAEITGSLGITGSLNVTNGITGSFTGSFSGSLFGTASFAVSSSRAITSSFAISSSQAQNSISSSYPLRVIGSSLVSTYVPGGIGGSTNSSIFIGYNSGYQATNANNSNFLGNNAGGYGTYAGFSNFFGRNAGYVATSASYSTLIGYHAGTAFLQNQDETVASIGPNNIIIGTNITLESGRQDSINLGAIIFATGSYSDTNSDVFSGSLGTGMVGINNPNPNYTLDVSGSINFAGDLYQNGTLFESGGTQKYMWYSIQIESDIVRYYVPAVVNPQQGMGSPSILNSLLPYTYVDIIDQDNQTTYTSLTFSDTTDIETFITDNNIGNGKVIIYSNRNNTGNLRVGGVNLFSTQITLKGRDGKVSSKRSYDVANVEVDGGGFNVYNNLTSSLKDTLVSSCSSIVPNFSTNYVNQTQVEAIVANQNPNDSTTYYTFAPINKYKKRQFSRYYVGRKAKGIDINGDEVVVSNPGQAKILGVAVYEWNSSNFQFQSFITNYGYSEPSYQKIGPSNAGGSMVNVYIVQTSDDCRALVVEPIGIDRILIPPSFDKISDVFDTPIVPNLTMYRRGNATQVATYDNRIDNILGIGTYLSPTLFSNFRIKTISEVDVINLYSDRTCDLFEKAVKLDKLKYTNRKYINLTLLNSNYQKN